MQSYELPRFPVVHGDLYRLTSAADLIELGFEDLPTNAVTLLEWPDRAAGLLPSDRFDVSLSLSPSHGDSFRHARVSGYGRCALRVERIAAVRRFLEASGYAQGAARAARRRCFDPLIRAAQQGRPDCSADELAAAGRTVRRCAMASLTARSRTSPRTSRPISR